MRSSRAALTAATILAFFAIPTPAPAAITPEARPVVERYVTALGGRAAFDGVHSMYEKITIKAFGMVGSVDVWTRRPDHTANFVSIGPFKISEGCDGEHAWRIDPNGKTVVQDGKDLEDARSDAWFANERWIDADQGGGTVSLAAAEKDTAGEYQVLEIAPPAGRSRRLWFDARTGLLARSVSKRDQNTMVSSVSDWRPVNGLLHSFRTQQQIQGMPANDASLVTDSLAVNVDIPDSRFALPTSEATPARWLKQEGEAHLPFDYATRHVWLRASVNGAPPADFLFDTGASITVLDSAYAASLGIRTTGRQQGQGAGATGGASFATVDSIRVAGEDGDGVVVRDVKLGVLSINPVLSPFFWRDAAGVLGFDFISRFVTSIDYDGRLLVLHDPKTYTYAGTGQSVPMTLAGTMPVVEMTLDGSLKGQFRVDVGSSSTLDLHAPFVKQNGLLQRPGKSVVVLGGGFGGTFRNTVRRMNTLRLGGYEIKTPLIGLSQATSGGFASEDYAGNIGNRLLERFHVTLDYERRVLHLEPGRRFADPDIFPRAGVSLIRREGVVSAAIVLPGSAAEKAGLREGDEVAAIDGKPAAEWTVETIAETLERGAPGSRHTLDVKRDGATRTLKLKLAEML